MNGHELEPTGRLALAEQLHEVANGRRAAVRQARRRGRCWACLAVAGLAYLVGGCLISVAAVDYLDRARRHEEFTVTVVPDNAVCIADCHHDAGWFDPRWTKDIGIERWQIGRHWYTTRDLMGRSS